MSDFDEVFGDATFLDQRSPEEKELDLTRVQDRLFDLYYDHKQGRDYQWQICLVNPPGDNGEFAQSLQDDGWEVVGLDQQPHLIMAFGSWQDWQTLVPVPLRQRSVLIDTSGRDYGAGDFATLLYHYLHICAGERIPTRETISSFARIALSHLLEGLLRDSAIKALRETAEEV